MCWFVIVNIICIMLFELSFGHFFAMFFLDGSRNWIDLSLFLLLTFRYDCYNTVVEVFLFGEKVVFPQHFFSHCKSFNRSKTWDMVKSRFSLFFRAKNLASDYLLDGNEINGFLINTPAVKVSKLALPLIALNT